MKRHRLATALMGKAATNHLNPEEVVEAAQPHGVSLLFLVPEDYLPLLRRLPEATSRSARIDEALPHPEPDP